MADENKVLGIRLEPDERKRFDEFVLEGSKSNKDFIKTLLDLYELNKGKVKNINLVGDIELLEEYTSKIHRAFINVIDKLESQKEGIEEHSQKDLLIYKDKVNTLQDENENIKLVNATSIDKLTEVNKVLLTLEQQSKSLNDSLKDKTALVEEYKNKNDMLLSDLAEYKQYKIEIETVKGLLASQQADNISLKDSIKDKEFTINELTKNIEKITADYEKELEQLKSKHAADLESLKDKSSILMDKALLELQKSQQEQLGQQQLKYNSDIQEYQSKYKSLLEELELTRSVPKPKTVKKGTNAEETTI